MDDNHRQLIIDNLDKLSGKITLRHLENELVASKLLSVAVLNSCKSAEEPVNEILKRITTRGPDAFYIFITCLLNTKHYEAAKILDPKLEFIPEDESDGIDGRRMQRTGMFYSTPTHHIYPMEAYKRGRALILSNTTFNDAKLNRGGGDIDEQNIFNLFQRLGFDVNIERNKEGNQMEVILKEFSRDEMHINANAAVIIIMSHGNEDGILGIDEKVVAESTIFTIFNEKHCPNLSGKPKLFFIQACRGVQVAYVTDSNQPPPIVYRSKMPLYSHMKVCFSTISDMVAYRSTETGSWFINKLVEVFLEKACNTELDVMLREVAWRINRMYTEMKAKQSIEVRSYGWDRDFYFNPGFYRLP